MKKISLLVTLILCAGMSYAQISLVTFSTGWSAPVDIKNCGDDRLFVVEQQGIIYICDTNGVKNPNPFLDIHGRVRYSGEEGLLGLAFPPDFLTSGYFYVNYTALSDDDTRISRFRVSATNPDSADPNSEEQLLRVYQPFSNHNGGHVAFGPDGYLYIGMGDGGSAGDPGNRAQNPDSLLGKMLRLEVDPSYPGYHIPPTNVFAMDTTLGRPEIYTLGMRNPWRWSFDRATGDLWIGDVGQNIVEEVDMQPAGTPSGLNYGWKCWEANLQNSTIAGCLPYSNYAAPVWYYNHSPGGYCSITGGYIYRGSKYQELYGKYFYADYCNSQIQYLRDSSGVFVNTNLGAIGATSVTTFGEDKNGEIYLSSNGNKIMKIVSADCSPVSSINLGKDTIADCGAGSVMLTVPVNSNYTYAWSDGSTTVGTAAGYAATQPGVYSVTVSNQGCSGTDSIVVIFNNPSPVSFTGLDSLYCVYHAPVILFPSTIGGTFSGPGMNGQGFHPTVAGIGTHQITYSLTDSTGCVVTNTQTVVVDACLGIPENNWTNTVNVIPNPATSNFHISAFSQIEKRAVVKISDITGRTVMNETYVFNSGENTIPVELNVPHGIYLVQITDETSSSVLKLIVE